MALAFTGIEEIKTEWILDNKSMLSSIALTENRFKQAISNMGTAAKSNFANMGTQVATWRKQNEQAAKAVGASWWERFGVVALGFTIAYRAMNLFENALRKVVGLIGEAIKESGELASVQAKMAFWFTMMSDGAITYSEAFDRAAANTRALQEAALNSISSLSEISTGVDEIAQTVGGLPPRLMKGTAALVDFASMVAQTTGSTTRQIRQELQALLSGQVRTTDQLIRSMKKMGVVTEEDIKNLKNMTNQVEILEKVINKVAPVWDEAIKKILSSDVNAAFEFWQKSLRLAIVDSISLASALEGVGNVFAVNFVEGVKKYREEMTQLDLRRQIEMILLLADAQKILINLFHGAISAVSTLATGIRNFGKVWEGLNESTKESIKLWAWYLGLPTIIRAFTAFGKVIIWLTIGPFFQLVRMLRTTQGFLIALPLLMALVGGAAVALGQTMDQVGKNIIDKFENIYNKIHKVYEVISDLASPPKTATTPGFLDALTGREGFEIPPPKLSYNELMDKFQSELQELRVLAEDYAATTGKSIPKVFFENWKKNMEAMWSGAKDFLAPYLEGATKLFGEIFDPELTEFQLLQAQLHAEAMAKGLGFVEKAAKDTGDELQDYTKRLRKLRIEAETARELFRAYSLGLVKEKDLRYYEQYLHALAESKTILKDQRAEFMKYNIETIKNVKALDDLLSRDRMVESLRQDLADVTLSERQYAEWLLNDKINKMLEERNLTKEHLAMITEFYKKAYQEIRDKYDIFSSNVIKVAQDTAQAMSQSFSDFFFDVFKGELKTLGDYVTGFMDAFLRSIADAFSRMLTQILMGEQARTGGFSGGVIQAIGRGIMGLLGGKSYVGWSGYQHGGWIREPVVGRGLLSGRGYRFAESGPEYVSPSGAGVTNIIVNNYSSEKAQANTSRNASGGQDVTITIGEMLANRDIYAGGPLHQSIRKTFQVVPRIGGR